MQNDMRPGVFSSYTVTSGAPAQRSAQYAAIVGAAAGGEAGKVYRFTAASEADAVFSGGLLPVAARLLLECGVAQVICVPAGVDGAAPGDDAYSRAFAAVEELENIGALVCDSQKQSVQALLQESVARSCEKLKERIALVTAGTADAAADAARALGSERLCLCYPACAYRGAADGFLTACAFAGALLTASPANPMNGAALHKGVALAGDNLPESDVQRLLRAGVAVFETAGGGAECIRAVTTRTRTNGEEDATFRSIATVRIIDNILQRARAGLKLLLRGQNGRGAGVTSIVAQMTVLLAQVQDEGLVTSFETPRATLDSADRSVCTVELCFEAATAVNQIHILAHISV